MRIDRVTRPRGRVLETEFHWRTPPTPEARQIFVGQVCPGMHFDTVEDWVQVYSGAGLTGLDTPTLLTVASWIARSREAERAR